MNMYLKIIKRKRTWKFKCPKNEDTHTFLLLLGTKLNYQILLTLLDQHIGLKGTPVDKWLSSSGYILGSFHDHLHNIFLSYFENELWHTLGMRTHISAKIANFHNLSKITFDHVKISQQGILKGSCVFFYKLLLFSSIFLWIPL